MGFAVNHKQQGLQCSGILHSYTLSQRGPGHWRKGEALPGATGLQPPRVEVREASSRQKEAILKPAARWPHQGRFRSSTQMPRLDSRPHELEPLEWRSGSDADKHGGGSWSKDGRATFCEVPKSQDLACLFVFRLWPVTRHISAFMPFAYPFLFISTLDQCCVIKLPGVMEMLP